MTATGLRGGLGLFPVSSPRERAVRARIAPLLVGLGQGADFSLCGGPHVRLGAGIIVAVLWLAAWVLLDFAHWSVVAGWETGVIFLAAAWLCAGSRGLVILMSGLAVTVVGIPVRAASVVVAAARTGVVIPPVVIALGGALL
jgi:hypothetical protein